MLKAEEVLRKIEETKLSKKLVLQKRDDLNNNQLKTNQGEKYYQLILNVIKKL